MIPVPQFGGAFCFCVAGVAVFKRRYAMKLPVPSEASSIVVNW